jgi:hypothetical protein
MAPCPAVAFWEGLGSGLRSVIFEKQLGESPTNI